MDGVLHNLARKQLRVQQCQPKRARMSRSASPSLRCAEDESVQQKQIAREKGPDITPPLKGILKPPKVHWPEKLGEPETADAQPYVSSSSIHSPESGNFHTILQSAQRSGFLPPPPPPPRLVSPPPPPPIDAPQPPSLWNPQIETDQYLSEAAYKLYTRFLDELSEFVEMQGEVSRMRLAVQEKRQELRSLRERVSSCDMLFIDHLRKCIAHGIDTNDVTLVKLFEAAQTARDQVGPLEAEYEPWEVELGAREHRLGEKYGDLEGRFEHFFRLKASSTQQSVPSNIEYETPTLSSEVSGEELHSTQRVESAFLHGAFVDNRIGIGQLPIQTRSGNNEHKGSLSEEVLQVKKVIRSLGTPDRSSKRFSNSTIDDNSPSEVPAELYGIVGAESITKIHSSNHETRNRRISQSLRGMTGNSIFHISESPEALSDEFCFDPGLKEGETLLLLEDDSETQSVLSNYLTTFESTRDRINRWMLHQLRLSPREAYSLRRRVTQCAPEISNWAAFVLSEWPKDMLGRDQSYHQGSFEDGSDNWIVPGTSDAGVDGTPSIPDVRYQRFYQPGSI